MNTMIYAAVEDPDHTVHKSMLVRVFTAAHVVMEGIAPARYISFEAFFLYTYMRHH